MKPVELGLRQVIIEPGVEIENVVFMESGLASIVAIDEEGQQAEVGHVGVDGLIGRSVILGVNTSSNRTFIQVSGHGLSISTRHFTDLIYEVPTLQRLFLRYIQVFETQIEQSALANARYVVQERLARWLLMCQDRIGGADLPLTHEFLALMLGVRRSGVTTELHKLEGLSMIKATRGNVRVLDRPGLLNVAGGCYGVPEREYDRLITNWVDDA